MNGSFREGAKAARANDDSFPPVDLRNRDARFAAIGACAAKAHSVPQRGHLDALSCCDMDQGLLWGSCGAAWMMQAKVR
ncbi:hypothetical protein thalar_03677 [Litoreibacter arenae DSM 19593]|uniref:Uncharacterized protein n=1 Tax=Litoreibacter arenae DSM 19593 TaxID=1123360 RepID=S9QA50_9RHOB|nr:hypothetical protein thalar_03677 [Litoreibacter arenae DSM 19593]